MENTVDKAALLCYLIYVTLKEMRYFALGPMFFLNSILLGVGLAMDAFSVSLANGLHEPRMRGGKMCGVAGVFALFQFLMPLVGWFCVHTMARLFSAFEKFNY